MIRQKVDYKISSALGNELKVTEEDLRNITVLEERGEDIVFMFKNKKYEARILSHDDGFKKAKIIVNNQTLELDLRDQLDQLVDKMGLSEIVDEAEGDVISPMPGLVIKMLVKEGDTIEKGESVLVLEAMKMENLLQSGASGIVKSIKCREGDSVNKGDVLVVIDDNI